MAWYFILLIGFALGLEVGRWQSGRKVNWKMALIAFLVAAAVAFAIALGMYFLKHSELAVSDFKQTSFTVDGTPTTLTGTTKYFGNEATGDLNGDGKVDEAFIFTQQPGGSGTFYYVAVVLRTAGGWQGTDAVLLGDRIAPQTTEIKNGLLIVNYADRLASEPFSAQPSVAKSMYLRVNGGKLIQTAAPGTKACTMEAKLCPDGSSVGRTGPNCEFAPCPR
jgi:hypothetical protein